MSPGSEAVKFHIKRIFCVCVYVLFPFFFFFSFLAPKQRWHRSIREWCNLDLMLWSAFGLIFLVWSKARCPQAAVLLMAFLGMKEQKKNTCRCRPRGGWLVMGNQLQPLISSSLGFWSRRSLFGPSLAVTCRDCLPSPLGPLVL